MRIYKIFLLLVFNSLAVILFSVQGAAAARLEFKLISEQNSLEQAAVLEVRLNPEGQTLNVVEGVVSLQGEIASQLDVNVETGGSVLELWTTAPRYLIKEQAVRFAGGAPNGFTADSLLFRLRLSAPVNGSVTAVWLGGAAYRHDGQGTKENISARSATISLSAQFPEMSSQISPDKTAPTFKFVDIGRDASAYDGRYFISFTAIDDLSGLDRYEVREGDETSIVTEGVYIFKDQSRRTPVVITAYDQAGNSQLIEVPVETDWRKYVIILAAGFLVLLVSFNVYRRIGKK